MEDRSPGAAELRTELLTSIQRWNETLAVDHPYSTAGLGAAMAAVRLVESLLRLAIDRLFTEVMLPTRPTLGELVGAIERHGMRASFSCLSKPRRLVIPTDMRTFKRLTEGRNALAHVNDHERLWATRGRFDHESVREMLGVAEAVARLPIIDELICRESIPAQVG